MFSNIWLFLKSLSFIDYVFFFTVIFLLVLIVSLIYFIRINEEIIEEEVRLEDPDNLLEITNKIKTSVEPSKPIAFTTYEKEQEDKAIISYDELLSNTGEFELNYASEEMQGDIAVKKIDLNNIVNSTSKIEVTKSEVPLLSLQKEEDFLKALKELQKQLN